MAYATISHWICDEWTDEMESIARDKYVPLIISLGAAKVQMIRTGELSFSVMTEYADEQTANAVQARVAEIRAEAAQELPMRMDESHAGAVFVTS